MSGSIEADPERVYLGLGSNLGESGRLIEEATQELGRLLIEMRVSRLYRTLPRDDENQPVFVNAVVEGGYRFSPRMLLEGIQDIENEFGRRRDPQRPKGPRSLDIDILLFGSRIIDDADLTVPHPRMGERMFVLVPLLELTPSLREPHTRRPYADFAEKLNAQGIYYISLKDYSDILSWEG